MLKSTHKSTSAQLAETAPLPEGWTEHKAPTGHSYYYHAETKKSTYQRPTLQPPAPVPPPIAAVQPIGPSDPSNSFLQYQSIPDHAPNGIHPSRGNFNFPQGDRGGEQQPQRPRGPQPTDKPKSRFPIPGQAPWILVNTKLGRRFVYNPDKGQSYWRIPDKLKAGILELDQQRIKAKVEAEKQAQEAASDATQGPALRPVLEATGAREPGPENGEDSSEYEEVEVTDDEADDGDEENAAKRPRLEAEDAADEPHEFNEDDIAFQLASMGQDYGLDPSEYQNDAYAEEEPLSHADATALFHDLLNDLAINPYSPWDKLVSDNILIDDARYTSLPTMKKRKEAFDTWSRDRIALLNSQRQRTETLDPKIPYLAFLAQHATPKLYYPEFKRKFRKEPAFRDSKLAEKEREKFYREFIARKKLPASQLKSDLIALLKAVPLQKLNNQTLVDHLPAELLGDVRYISIDPTTRDVLVEGWISTLGGPPADGAEKNEEQLREQEARRRREAALREREERVEEAKRKQRRALEFGKEQMREGEREIERALNVGKAGLRGHLVDS